MRHPGPAARHPPRRRNPFRPFRTLLLLLAGIGITSGLASPAHGGLAHRSADLSPSPILHGSQTDNLLIPVPGGKVLFVDDTAKLDVTLWVTDGTPEATHSLVAPQRLGLDRRRFPLGEVGQGPTRATIFEAHAAFSDANTLWRSDGTVEGTFPIVAPGRFLASAGSFGVARDLLCLLAVHPTFGIEPACTDGAPDGTTAGGAPHLTFLGDLTPGSNRSSYVSDWIEFQGRIYFFQRDFLDRGGPGSLWVTDGTAEGTERIADMPRPIAQIHRGEVFESPRFRPADSYLLFHGIDESGSGLVFWATDGTAEGTRRLAAGPGLSTPVPGTDAYAALGDRLYFPVAEPFVTPRLWVTDGTPEGTGPVLAEPDDEAPALVCEPRSLAGDGLCPGAIVEVSGDSILFRGADTDGRVRLFTVSASAPVGTARPQSLLGPCVDGLCPAVDGFRADTVLGALESLGNGRALFVTQNAAGRIAAFSTDGTQAGTRLEGLAPRSEGHPSTLFIQSDEREILVRWPKLPTDDGRALRFDRTSGAVDELVFLGDPSQAGTNAYPLYASVAAAPSSPRRHYVYFGRDPEGSGHFGVVVSDGSFPAGSEPGARLLHDRGRSTEWTRFGPPAATAEGAVVRAEGWDGNAARAVPGLYRVGEMSSERLLAQGDGVLGDPWSLGDSRALILREPEGRLTELWITDGTTDGTTLLAPLDAAPLLHAVEGFPTLVGDDLYFFHGGHLWSTDGSLAGTRRVWTPEDPFRFLFGVVPLGQRVLIHGGNTGTASTWWIGPSPLDGSFLQLTNFPVPTETPTEARRWDSSAAGTEQDEILWQASRIFDEEAPEPSRTVIAPWGEAVAQSLYVREPLGPYTALWTTNGTDAGTQLLFDPGEWIPPGGMAVLGDRLYVISMELQTDDDSRRGIHLWSLDGTPGTADLVHSWETRANRAPVEMVATAERIVFSLNIAEVGREPWASDGTPEGTVLLSDLFPGLPGSDAYGLTVAENRVYFGARHPRYGWELWSTDGSREGTRLAQDLCPGADASTPFEMTALGDRLYFSADDGLVGRELWWIDLEEEGCPDSPFSLCLADGRFELRADWRDFEDRHGRGRALPLTADTGAFWFFREENLELAAKILDARRRDGHFWTFYASLSSVRYDLTITDSETGVARRYFNPPKELASLGDTTSLGPRGVPLDVPVYDPLAGSSSGSTTSRATSLESLTSSSLAGPLEHREPSSITFGDAKNGSGIPCEPTPQRLCLVNGRFSVEIAWTNFQGDSGAGTGLSLTEDTAAFWFFRQANLEVLVKILDGRRVNDAHWVFVGALTNVAYELTVHDHVTGITETYVNPPRRFSSFGDTETFVEAVPVP